MGDETVIAGIDVPDASDFVAAEKAKAWRGASPTWLIWLVAFAQPIAILLIGAGTATYVSMSPEWALHVVTNPGQSLFMAFSTGMISWCVVGFLCLPLLYWRRRSLKPLNDLRLRPHRFKAREDAFEIENDDVRTTYKWTTFDDVTRYKDAYILWHRDELRYYLPLRAFASPADAEAFFGLAKRRVGAMTD